MHEHSLSLPNFSFAARRRTKRMGLVVAIICRKDYCIMLAQVRIICHFVKLQILFVFDDVRHVAGEQEIKPLLLP